MDAAAVDRIHAWRRRLKRYTRPSFDPFSIFKVSPQSCHILYVVVLRGRNISKGKLRDKFDMPDPYVKGYVPQSKSLVQRTSTCDNTKTPEWNESFRFIIDPDIKNTLRLELWEDNVVSDDPIETQDYDIGDLPIGDKLKVTIDFKKGREVDIEIQRIVCDNPDVRHSLTLCDEEKVFFRDRKKKVLEAMKNILGDKAPQDICHVPVIAVMGSGGGFRAATAFSGSMSGLDKTNVLPMVTYMAGVSGSAWYLAYLYSHPEWPQVSPDDLMEDLQDRLNKSPVKTSLDPNIIGRFLRDARAKNDRGQPLSFVDFYGQVVADIILRDQRDATLSDQKAKVNSGNVALPIYTSIRVKPNTPATQFHEWIEYSPYEISIPKYGVSIPPYLFNSRFYLGRLIERFPEAPLHFLVGIWGSFFAIMLSRLSSTERSNSGNSMDEDADPMTRTGSEDTSEDCEDGDTDLPPSTQESQTDDTEEIVKTGFKGKIMAACLNHRAFNSRRGRAARVLNFMRGITFRETQSFSPFSPTYDGEKEELTDDRPDETLSDVNSFYTVDAGLAVNLPIPPLLRPQRQVDLLLSFDFSSREQESDYPFKELKEAEDWARARGVPFPPINITREDVEKDGVKECYIFKDDTNDLCPIVVHFVLVNKSFRNCKRPGVKRETNKELEFGNFNVFGKKESTYSTFNIQYTNKAFARLFALTQYNMMNNISVVHEAIIESINRRRRRMKNASTSWELSKAISVAAGNFNRLIQKKDVCAQGLKKIVAQLSGDKVITRLGISQEDEDDHKAENKEENKSLTSNGNVHVRIEEGVGFGGCNGGEEGSGQRKMANSCLRQSDYCVIL